MADSRPSTADEKAAIHKHKGFFSRKKSTVPDDNIDEKGGIIMTEVKPVVPELAPVAFSELFRSVTLLGAFWLQCLPFDQILHKIRALSKCYRFTCCYCCGGSSGVYRLVPDPEKYFNFLFLAPDVPTFRKPDATVRQLCHHSSQRRCRQTWFF